jgi:hypothetical protein
MRYLGTLEAQMTTQARRGTGDDRATGSGSRATSGEERRRWKRDAGEGGRNAGSSRGGVRQSAAASFPLDYRFSVL